MKILVGCEESQVVMKCFRSMGHDAWSCDVQEPSGGLNQYHIKGDLLSVVNEGWDMLIAFPPCTYLTRAGAGRLYSNKNGMDMDRYYKGMEARNFFLTLYRANIKYICLENPTPMLVFKLPKATQAVEPYMFGHRYTKKTWLWLKNLPKLRPTKVVKPRGSWIEIHRNKKVRSKTFLGIAKAMANQWGNLK